MEILIPFPTKIHIVIFNTYQPIECYKCWHDIFIIVGQFRTGMCFTDMTSLYLFYEPGRERTTSFSIQMRHQTSAKSEPSVENAVNEEIYDSIDESVIGKRCDVTKEDPAYEKGKSSWWRHQMEIFSALLATCAGKSRSPVNSPHKGQWGGALVFSLICVWINGWVNSCQAGDLRRHLAHFDVTVMCLLGIVRFCFVLCKQGQERKGWVRGGGGVNCKYMFMFCWKI